MFYYIFVNMLVFIVFFFEYMVYYWKFLEIEVNVSKSGINSRMFLNDDLRLYFSLLDFIRPLSGGNNRFEMFMAGTYGGELARMDLMVCKKHLTAKSSKFSCEDMLPTEVCWQTGNYSDGCNCSFCEHQAECSGFDCDDE